MLAILPAETIMARAVARFAWPIQLFVNQDVKIDDVGNIPHNANITAK
jgi:hypothetical protein